MFIDLHTCSFLSYLCELSEVNTIAQMQLLMLLVRPALLSPENSCTVLHTDPKWFCIYTAIKDAEQPPLRSPGNKSIGSVYYA